MKSNPYFRYRNDINTEKKRINSVVNIHAR